MGVERRVLVRAWGIVLFVYLRLGLIPGAVIHRANKLTQANRPRFSFARGFKIGAAADVFLVDENLRHGFNRFANGFFQSSFADAFGMNIHVAVVEIITLVGQFFCQFFSANAVRAAPDDQKITVNIASLLKPQPDGEWRL